jgi:hypothetical protein
MENTQNLCVEVRWLAMPGALRVTPIQKHDAVPWCIDVDDVFVSPNVVCCIGKVHDLVAVESVTLKPNVPPRISSCINEGQPCFLLQPKEEMALKAGDKILNEVSMSARPRVRRLTDK